MAQMLHEYGRALGADLANNPDLAADPAWVLKIAAEEWVAVKCDDFADKDDLRRVTKAINGGLVGLGSRQDWLAKTKHVWL